MGQDTHGVNKKNKFLLSNYSLTYQLLFINLLVALIGFVSFLFFNFYLIQNDRNIEKDYDFANIQINKITSYLELNSILRVPLFNENCVNITDYKNCENIVFSEPELEPTRTQKYIVQNFLNQGLILKVYNDNWIKFVDTNDMYTTTDVSEIDLNLPTNQTLNLMNKYKTFYSDFFNQIRGNFLKNKYSKDAKKLKSEINVVSETIKNKEILTYKFINKDNELFQYISTPIIYNNKIYGVVIVSYPLISNNFEVGLTSFNLFNFYILFVLVMLLLSFFFSGSLVKPIKQLSQLTVIERQKIVSKIKSKYPERGDEIGTLSNEIQNMSMDLKSQIDQLEKFAADVSHELKNPLTSLQSANELLINNKITNKNKEILIQNMKKDIERMNRLISDISNFTKIKAEIETEKFNYINISSFILEIIDQYSVNKKNIKIISENNLSNETILANQSKLSQVFYNLIDNSISISEKDKKILIVLESEKENLYIKVYDQGKGIPINQGDKIFNRFYTDRENNQNKHTGLGLTIAKEIIKSFKGCIKLIRSDKIAYTGACFVIKLPLKVDQTKKNTN